MKKLPWRAALYLLVIGYLVLDLKVCHGPLRDAMRSRRDAAVEAARERGWVALVNQEPITREQVDLAVTRHLHQRGKDVADIPDKNIVMIRRAVLQSIIDDTLVRQHADGEKFDAPAEETAAFIATWKSGFTSPEEIAKRAAAQGLDPVALDTELARIWSRKRWLEKRIEPGVTVTEEEAKAWYEANRLETGGQARPGFFEPEKVRARHILLAPEAEAAARELYRKLVAREVEFADVARAQSRDPRTKEEGGEIGWIAAEGLPDEFTTPVFALSAGELGEPFQTSLGWHLVEVLERQELRTLVYEEIRAEIVAHLEAQRTEETVKTLMGKLRKVANLQVFPENL